MAIAALAVTVAAASGARAQDATAQTDFFREGSTARSFGMGNAFVAVADDIGAAYWNPAGLALLSGATFSTTRSTLDIFDLNTQTLSFAAPVYGGVAALNFVYSSISGGIETEFDPITGRLVPVGTFEETDSALSLSFGKEYRENLYLGGTLKHARQKVSRFSASGFGLDLAALYQYNDYIRAGLVLQNVADMDIGSDTIPFNVRVGASIVVPQEPKLLIAVSYETEYLNESVASIGAEYRFADNLTARLGGNEDGLSAGLGVRFDKFHLDYSFNRNDDSGDENRLTVGYYVESKKKAPEKKGQESQTAAPTASEQPRTTPSRPERAKKTEEPAEEAASAADTAPATAADETPKRGRGKKDSDEDKPSAVEESPAASVPKRGTISTPEPAAQPEKKQEPIAALPLLPSKPEYTAVSESDLKLQPVGAGEGRRVELPGLDDLLGEPEPPEARMYREEQSRRDGRIGEGSFRLEPR
jgi:hypothetical protein